MQHPQALNMASPVLVREGAPGMVKLSPGLGLGETKEGNGTRAAMSAAAVRFTYEGHSMTLPIGEE